MAEYIENVAAQTSKLDWAFPFERKGQFPLDRSAIFSSLADANKYATGDGSDERKLGGTSYVGQIISVYEAGEGESAPTVNAYIITPARGLMKLAATTASGDVAADISDLQGKVNTVTSDLNTLEETVSKMYTNEQIDELVAGAKDDRVDSLVTDVESLQEAVSKLPTEDTDTTYIFTSGTEGTFTVTPKDGESIEVDTGAKTIVEALDRKVTDAGYQNASQVTTAISNALADYYNKAAIDETVEDLEGKISAIPKFAIEVVSAKEDGTPDVTTPSTTTVYLIPDNDTTTSDVYDEYIYVNGSWELLGKQTLDLTGYATETFVTDEIAKLTAENGAVKVVADKVTALEETVGNSTDGLVKDVADLKAIDHDKLISDAIAAHNEAKDHLTSSDVNDIVSAKYDNRLKDIEDNISTLPTTADIEAVDNNIAVKAVDTNEFNLSEDKTLSINEISQDKITGLADAFNAINKNISDLDAYVGDIPTDEKYADVTNVISYINKKAEETLAAANGGSSESAASVAQALETYKSENDPKVRKNTEDIASIVAKLDKIDENAQENVIEEIKIAGVALAITDKIVDIPAATTEKFGVIKLGSEFQKNEETDALEIKEVNVNKLVQTDGDVLILNGGLASNLVTE